MVGVWYLMGWLHYLIKDADSARFYLEQMKSVSKWLCGKGAGWEGGGGGGGIPSLNSGCLHYTAQGSEGTN